MNFCSNCGAKRTMKANFCSNCGTAFNSGVSNQQSFSNNNENQNFGSNSMLGTLVTVQLLNGLTQNLYQRDGKYYQDQGCNHEVNPAMIMGVMGRDVNDTIDTMTLMGKKVDMETMGRNQMAKKFMQRNNDINKFFK